MKRKITFFAVALLAFSVTSCRGYEREQDRLDKESEGKGMLLKAESTKKVKIEQSKADFESAKLDAQTNITKANSSAEATLIKAKADAAARIMYAESQAKANDLLSRSITPEIIEYNKVNKWSGKLPTTSVGSGASTLITIK